MYMSQLGTNLNIPSRQQSALAFTTFSEQLFSLLKFCGIGDLTSFASEAETNGSPTEQGQDSRVHSP
jgi:hypothetical protein